MNTFLLDVGALGAVRDFSVFVKSSLLGRGPIKDYGFRQYG